MFSSYPKGPLVRLVAGLGGLAVLGWALAAILSPGDLHYRNWLGELVFGPFAILFGLALILSALFKPEILGRPSSRSKR